MSDQSNPEPHPFDPWTWDSRCASCGQEAKAQVHSMNDQRTPKSAEPVKLGEWEVGFHGGLHRVNGHIEEEQYMGSRLADMVNDLEARLASAKAERETWRDWKKLNDLITANANDWKARAEAAEAGLKAATERELKRTASIAQAEQHLPAEAKENAG